MELLSTARDEVEGPLKRCGNLIVRCVSGILLGRGMLTMDCDFGFCLYCESRIEIDFEELQRFAGEAWEQVVELVCMKVSDCATYEEKWAIAIQNGLPLWCEECGEPIDDLLLFSKAL